MSVLGREDKGLIADAATATASAAALGAVAAGVGGVRETSVASNPRSITRCELPPGALLQSYVAKGAFTDCYATEIGASVGFADYVEAFYTSGAFKCERLVLLAIGKPSSDADVRRLARGEAEAFAAWSVEARAPDQLLVCDFLRRTRSWLMLAPVVGGGSRLYFGSAVVPVGVGAGARRLGFPFNALLGFHQVYSKILLGAARGRVLGFAQARVRAAREL